MEPTVPQTMVVDVLELTNALLINAAANVAFIVPDGVIVLAVPQAVPVTTLLPFGLTTNVEEVAERTVIYSFP
jgi:hypothetical protein